MRNPGVRLAVGLVVGAIVALIVYIVGVEIVDLRHEGLIVGLVALLAWAGIAWLIYTSGPRRVP